MLLHSEYPHPWDPWLSILGVGTPADHHVHHAKFKFNFGHLFMYWDKLFGKDAHIMLLMPFVLII